MKTYYEVPDEPYKLFVMLPDGTMKEQQHYACAHCKHILSDRDLALNCCKQDHCKKCNAPTEKYWSECSSCREVRIEEEAAIVEDYEGPLTDGSEMFYEDMAQYLDGTIPGEEEEFLFCCTVTRLKDEDAASIVGNMVENIMSKYHEDSYDQVVGEDELTSAVQAWLDKQTVETWYQDSKRKVRVPKGEHA